MSRGHHDAVAIVGVGGIFPGAADTEAFWSLIDGVVDATGQVPPGRWLLDPDQAYDPRVPHPDRVYSTRGGFCDEPELDPTGLRMDAQELERLDPAFRFALHAARQAWDSARTEALDPARVGVIFGHIVLPTEKSSAFSRELLGRPIEESLGIPGVGRSGTDPLNAFPAGLPAAMVARALGLGGPAFTLDAACASTLYAIKLAADALLSGQADAMISGGVSRPDPLYTQMGFSQLLALSARGKPAPFDENGDGLVVGEGAGLFVLKRLSDALGQGDTIHAVIRGIGLSNDVHGDLLAPSSEGQLRAMRAAYAEAGWSPLEVDLIECHATGTPVGDAVEVESLKQLWGDRDSGWSPGQCVIGSVKSNVGHLLTAAGAAGLLKILLAFRHRVKPATANQTRPSSRLGLSDGPFRVLSKAESWKARTPERHRRAAISGFGFGGINAHVLLEEWDEPVGSGHSAAVSGPHGVAVSSRPGPIAIVGMATHFGGAEGLEEFQRRFLGLAEIGPLEPATGRWRPVDSAARAPSMELASPAGHYLRSFRLGMNRFRIPPRELGEILPQQSLMLKVAAEAIEDASWPLALGPRTGVVVGLGLDQGTNDYQLRWWLSAMAPHWNRSLGLGLAPDELERWVGELLATAGPSLTANRTMGSLGGLVASRIAREFRIGGPSFSVSCDEGSGIEAVRLACGWLSRDELDAVVVGAVDIAGDVRAVVARQQLGQVGTPGEGAVALVLRQLEDAVRDGDRIYALIPPNSLSTANPGGRPQSASSLASCSTLERTKAVIGHVGAALGLAAVAGAATALHFQVRPPESEDSARTTPPRPWLRNRDDGPRMASVQLSSLGGIYHSLELVEHALSDSQDSQSTQPPRPLVERAFALFALEADDREGLVQLADELIALASGSSTESVDALARRWWRERRAGSRGELGMAIVASSVEAIRRSRDAVRAAIRGETTSEIRQDPRSGLAIFPPSPSVSKGARLAFVYPGLGNVFPGMGRDLGLHFPEVLRRQDLSSGRLAEQLQPERFWSAELPWRFEDHRSPIVAQVAVASLVTDVLGLFGVKPDAAIGYSMGESAALVALGAWSERDELARRLGESPLFATELAGPCHAARRAWGLPGGQSAEWVAGIVPAPASRIQAAIGDGSRVYVLIRNSAEETLIGGYGPEVRKVVHALGVPLLELPTVSTVHCPVGHVVEPEYRALHDLPTATPAGIDFYSGISARPYHPDRSSAADAITAQATGMIDFPAVIDRAYADGARIFLEAGPGGSCTRLIGHILGDLSHMAFAACLPERDALGTLLEVLGRLIACRVPVDLDPLYGGHVDASSSPASREREAPVNRSLTIEVGRMPWVRMPHLPVRARLPEPEPVVAMPEARRPAPTGSAPATIPPTSTEVATPTGHPSMQTTDSPLLRQVLQTEAARAAAHEAFLRVSQDLSGMLARALDTQFALLEGSRPGIVHIPPIPETIEADRPPLQLSATAEFAGPPRSLDRMQCLAFAVGSIGSVLGRDFAPIDAYPTRVRLPDEPLMLVDRIVSIEGEPLSMTGGQVVTEHDILQGGWYLDAGRIPSCIAIEAGQADLFLSGFLGIDFETRGLAVYRLLDATVTFHRGLPGPGEVIRYDIRITRFFRQGETHLFRFEFDGTVGGEPLLTMRDGCAGFFSAEELAAGKGVVPRPLDSRPRSGVRPEDWKDLVPMAATTLDDHQVDALRRGALAEAFGTPFDRLELAHPLPLPGGRMTLVHRVLTLDPDGGRFGLGLIRAEADIHPDDWFMVCHFVDDRVMPGTLMYECCLHTLRIFLMRMGWVGPSDRVAFEPLPGVANRLRCRGQVIESTSKVVYEVVIKELGYGPEPYAIADALMYADGRPIVEISDMAMRLSGTDRTELERLWAEAGEEASSQTGRPGNEASDVSPSTGRRPRYDRERILAFAVGKPSDAYGERYRPFDEGRFIARLPAPPYSFLDRIVELDGEPWEMKAGASAVAEYDIPPDAWYFEADRQDHVPYAVLLEAALQSCGWTSAFMGSALHSDGPLKFRNLGGTATQHARIGRDSGTMRTRATVTKVTRSAGMIIQHYDFSVESPQGLVFDGQTYFGFFHPDALAEQVGIREASPYLPSPDETVRARTLPVPDLAPFPDARWRMIDRVETFVPGGGPMGLGLIEGTTRVNPDAWFFKAHFLGDPVWPGSLGLESLLQLLKFVAAERWGVRETSVFQGPALGATQRWSYRGQITPGSRLVKVQAIVTDLDEARRTIKADGLLVVDGVVIYQMNDFTLQLEPH